MKHHALCSSALVLVAALAGACSGANSAGSTGSSSPGAGGSDGGSHGGGGVPVGEGGGDAASTIAVTVGSGSTGSGQTSCDAGPDEDRDGDGITKAAGDCNDCDANVNPNALEVVVTEPDPETGEVPEPADEDCDGVVDNPPPAACDQDLALATGNPADAARALELCQQAPAEGGWGLVSSRWVRPAGGSWTEYATPGAKVGILESFGPAVPPRGGARVLGLSSGRARLPGQPDACNSADCSVGGPGSAPPGFPADTPGCDGGPGTSIHDDVALEVTLRAPSNATGYSFDFKFYTFEYTEWVCTQFNDQFIAHVTPAPAGAQNGNVSFDANGNPVSVNIGFFDVCTSCAQYAAWCHYESAGCPSAPSPCCPAGGAELQGTGFDTWTSPNDALPPFGDPSPVRGGGTSWLRTTAPVQPGEEITIRFAIWDAGDGNLDSTAIIDNFRWIANGGTVVVETGEVPDGPN